MTLENMAAFSSILTIMKNSYTKWTRMKLEIWINSLITRSSQASQKP